MYYPITFNDRSCISRPISFGYWDDNSDEYDYNIWIDNMKRSKNLPSIEFIDDNIYKGFINRYGSYVHMVSYINSMEIYSEIITQFPDRIERYLKKCSANEYYMRQQKSPFDRSIYNIGYMGVGNLNSLNHKLFYDFYHSMMERGYSDKQNKKHPSYTDVTVHPFFWNFQNFCKWCIDNYYIVPGQHMHLDKDILIKGNKIYSPDTCIFVPHHINSLFTKSDSIRGVLPIGVSLSSSGRYISRLSRISDDGTKIREYLGISDTPEDAFHLYKGAKEQEIKRVANLYRDWIPDRLYFAMINWQVEMND